jgi:hypothetical protein
MKTPAIIDTDEFYLKLWLKMFREIYEWESFKEAWKEEPRELTMANMEAFVRTIGNPCLHYYSFSNLLRIVRLRQNWLESIITFATIVLQSIILAIFPGMFIVSLIVLVLSVSLIIYVDHTNHFKNKMMKRFIAKEKLDDLVKELE